MDAPDLSGQTLGTYTLGKMLGSGGMASVYESYQIAVKRKVAIKILPASLSKTPGYTERFAKEVEVIARLEHPHILPIYDHGVDKNISYVVMRLLTEGSLQDRLYHGPTLSIAELLTILRQVGSALDYAHKNGIVHRDLKPSNILFDLEGNAYLSDFGIAKLIQGETSGLTGTGQILGTPSYMAPEQWRADRIDARTDIYAFGAMTYYLLTGQVPFDAPTPFALMHMHLNNEPTPPSRLTPQLPPMIDAVIAMAIAKDPDDRYVSASQFVTQVEEALTGSGIVPSNATILSEADTLPPSPRSRVTRQMIQDAPTSLIPETASSRKYWLGIGIVIGVMVLGVALVWVLLGDREDSVDEAAGGAVTFTEAVFLPSTEAVTEIALADETAEAIATVEVTENASPTTISTTPPPTETAAPIPTNTATLTPTETVMPSETPAPIATMTPSRTPNPTRTSRPTLPPTEVAEVLMNSLPPSNRVDFEGDAVEGVPPGLLAEFEELNTVAVEMGQADGQLYFRVQSLEDGGGLGLRVSQPVRGQLFHYVEYDLMVSSDTRGAGGTLETGLASDNVADNILSVGCHYGAYTPNVAPTLKCDVYHGVNYEILYTTPIIAGSRDKWLTLRMELDASTGVYRFFADGEEFGSYTYLGDPFDMQIAIFSTSIGFNIVPYSKINLYVDNIAVLIDEE